MKTYKRMGAIGLAILVTIAAGCNPKAPTANVPAKPATKVAAKDSPPPSLRIPKIEPTPPLDESPDAPPAPVPTPIPAVSPSEDSNPSEKSASNKSADRVLAKSLAPRFSPEGPVNVIMSEGHRQICLTKVGDTFPALSFVNGEGEKIPFASLYGERITIVVFWNNENVLGREQFARMQGEIAARYGIAGVSIVAVNVGDSTETFQKLLTESPQPFPCLLDPDGAGFKKIATKKLPRTYLLDKSGKILWLDIEYSRDMLRDLDNAVHLFLRNTT